MENTKRSGSESSFENVVVISRSREEVFWFLASFENVPRWNPAIERTDQTTLGPVGVGTRYRQVRTTPRQSEDTFEVVWFEPPRRLMITGRINQFRAQLGYTLEADGDATVVTNRVDLEPPGILPSAFLPLVVSQLRKAVASNLVRLKAVLESGG